MIVITIRAFYSDRICGDPKWGSGHTTTRPLYCSIKAVLTCGMRGAMWASRDLAGGGSVCLHSQFYSTGEGPITHLIGGRHFHQVDVPWLQILQQSHSDAPCKRTIVRDGKDYSREICCNQYFLWSWKVTWVPLSHGSIDPWKTKVYCTVEKNIKVSQQRRSYLRPVCPENKRGSKIEGHAHSSPLYHPAPGCNPAKASTVTVTGQRVIYSTEDPKLGRGALWMTSALTHHNDSSGVKRRCRAFQGVICYQLQLCCLETWQQFQELPKFGSWLCHTYVPSQMSAHLNNSALDTFLSELCLYNVEILKTWNWCFINNLNLWHYWYYFSLQA